MFGSKKNRKIKANRVSTVVGQGTEVHGNISFAGGLHVDGIIKGNVTGDLSDDSILSLSELGMIEGEVRVPMVILNGSVLGNVFASERVELAPKSKVTGDVTYNLIEMAVGAEVNGRLLRDDKPGDGLPISPKVKLKAGLPRKNRQENLLPESWLEGFETTYSKARRQIESKYNVNVIAQAPVDLTGNAAAKVGELLEKEANHNLKLRVYITGGGCSGFQYGFAFDEEVNEDDTAIERDGVTVLIDAMSIEYLNGAEIDYKDDLTGSQFIIRNPNASTTCGCGSSFSI